MRSGYLGNLNRQEYDQLVAKLYDVQNGKCFICEEDIDLKLHSDSLDIDHIIPLKLGGKDDPINFALTHSSCNRSKQDSNLEIARILKNFEKIKTKVEEENRSPNLQDILNKFNGAKYKLNFSHTDEKIKYSLSQIGDNKVYEI